MNRALHILRDSPLDGPSNMARDEQLLHADAAAPAVVRIYGWETPTISLGCFQRFARVAQLPPDVRSLPVVRRVTGGGAILHDREVTYCLVMNESLDLARASPGDAYRLVHECWRDALAQSGIATELAPNTFPPPSPRSGPFFCFEEPGRTDLLLNGVKLLGSAQRRTRGHVLQHGSLLLDSRFASHPGTHLGGPAADTVAGWVDAFLRQLAARLDLALVTSEWTRDGLADVAGRRVKYAGDEWTRRR